MEEVVFPLQQSVGSAFTVAEQSGRHSRPIGSTWHAISSALGMLAAQPAQPKHTSPGDQNNAKQTRFRHTGTCEVEEGGATYNKATVKLLCMLLMHHSASRVSKNMRNYTFINISYQYYSLS